MQVNAYSPSALSNYYKALHNTENRLRQMTSAAGASQGTADNPAAIAILQGLTAQTNGLNQAYNNSQDAISMLNTAEGGLRSSTDIAQRMRELNIQAANGTLTDEDRSYINQEASQLRDALNFNANTTQYNGINTNDGSWNMAVQTGANNGQFFNFALGNTSADALGINSDVSTQENAINNLSSIDNGLSQLLSYQSSIGAAENGLESTGNSLQQTSSNLQSASANMGGSDLAQLSMLFQQSKIQMYASIMALSQNMKQQSSTLSLLA